jgi:hypothetical protein
MTAEGSGLARRQCVLSKGGRLRPAGTSIARIVSVTQMGDAAGVVLLFGEDWIDFRSPVRVNRVWKVTNKTATHSSR